MKTNDDKTRETRLQKTKSKRKFLGNVSFSINNWCIDTLWNYEVERGEEEMEYVTVIILTVDAMLAIMAVVFSIVNNKVQQELNNAYEETIEEYRKGYEELNQKYKKVLDFKYNIRLIMLNAEANKENYFETVSKIKKELDKTPIQY